MSLRLGYIASRMAFGRRILCFSPCAGCSCPELASVDSTQACKMSQEARLEDHLDPRFTCTSLPPPLQASPLSPAQRAPTPPSPSDTFGASSATRTYDEQQQCRCSPSVRPAAAEEQQGPLRGVALWQPFQHEFCTAGPEEHASTGRGMLARVGHRTAQQGTGLPSGRQNCILFSDTQSSEQHLVS